MKKWMFKWKSKKPRQREMQFQKLMENDAYRTLLGGVVGASAGYAMKPQSIKQLMFSSSIQKSQPQATKQPARQTTYKNILKKSLGPKYLPKRKEETKRLSINNKIPQPQKGLSKLERLKQWNNGQHERKVEQPPRKSNINQRLSSLRDKYNDKRSQLIEKYPFIKRENAQVEALKLENEELHERLQRLEEKIDAYKHRKQNNKKRFFLF
ncbi:hypothetical protein [Staphylococcus equorum]|uniref:hypothetical protein n=1 Tax=Staphylococcus equorum TaxID=246432 RepID=UPI003D808ABE